MMSLCVCVCLGVGGIRVGPRAGHFWYFLIFSIIKIDFYVFFIKLITCFCTSPI